MSFGDRNREWELVPSWSPLHNEGWHHSAKFAVKSGHIPLSWKPPCRSRQVGEGASLRRDALSYVGSSATITSWPDLVRRGGRHRRARRRLSQHTAKAALIITLFKLTHYQFVGLRRASRYMRPIARASRCRQRMLLPARVRRHMNGKKAPRRGSVGAPKRQFVHHIASRTFLAQQAGDG